MLVCFHNSVWLLTHEINFQINVELHFEKI